MSTRSLKNIFQFFVPLLVTLLTTCNRPQIDNVLIILVDDLGHADLGVTGSSFYQTPNIDSLAAASMIFKQGYAGSRVCSPSRATIITGKFTATHGITDWIGAKTGEAWREHQRHDKLLPANYAHQLAASETTLAEAFSQAGYLTFYAGKWHLGGEGSYPEDHGFDINKGGWEKGSPMGGFFAPWDNPKLAYEHPGENLTMRLASETAKFIRDHKHKKFFAMLSFYAVHSPIQTTREKWAKYRQIAEASGIKSNGYKMERVLPIREVQDNPIYAGLVETVDDAVGLVMKELRAHGLEKNTMVIFTSDNGGVASGDNYSTSNLPLRGGKGYQWEGGLRVPYFVSIPGAEAGESDYPVTGADIYPTLIDLLGLPASAQEVDGQSLGPLLLGKGELPGRPLIWHYPHYGNQGGEPSSIIRRGDWKLIHYYEDQRQELYHLKSDPAESIDLITQNPEVAKSLGSELDKWLAKTGAVLPELDPEYDHFQALARKKYLEEELWPTLEAQRKEVLLESFQPNEDWWGSEPQD
jgi:arylsulfatase A-like enzyme